MLTLRVNHDIFFTNIAKLLKCTKYRLDLCFDVHGSPSIKDVKKKAREYNEFDCCFTFGPKQSLPPDFGDFRIQNINLIFTIFNERVRRRNI